MTVIGVHKNEEHMTTIMTAEFDAPIQRVWEMWSNPRKLERSWGPPTYPDGDQAHGCWKIRALDPPYHLEFDIGFADEQGNPDPDMPTMVMRVALAERSNGGTIMTLETMYPSLEVMDRMVAMGMEEGLSAAMSQMDAVLASGEPVMEAVNLDDIYGTPMVQWTRVTERLDQGLTQAPGTGGPQRHTCWLATINSDGRPHVTGVGALWVDGAFWFETGDRTRKARNIARDPRCTLSVATDEFDLVVDGDAHKVTDPATVAAMAARWAADGWPAQVDESGFALTANFSAPSAGPPPWFVYRLTPRTATALVTVDPGGATRFWF